ncbi:ventricular zone-expressed PH domain-containing protein [Hoplias malabaricus]|uniref:ventricular zone-expressed PH domain-containing protein n=1 Tax=Hoplias malabaricus TaxID=27720 RepID=UPI00346248BE
MHQLFRLVLGQRDLSRAGDLFSLDDGEIEGCLSQALEEIKNISCSPDYLTNDNDQAVVEICITRITTAIRETGSIERHGSALVSLWESCLEHNLQPQDRDEDTPHAKIASDITSCILQNYNRAPVMALAVPVAVRFLQQGNPELRRNMSSYLSLAAIAKAELLVQHTKAITLSFLAGNTMLLRILPSLYPLQPETIHLYIRDLMVLIPELDPGNRQHLLRLLQMISEQHPLVLTPLVPSLVRHLSDATLDDALLTVLVGVAQTTPASLSPFLPALRTVGQQAPGLLGHVAKIHGAVGLSSEDQAREALVYLVSQLECVEHNVHHTLLLEIHSLTDHYSHLLGGGAKDIYRISNSFSAIARQLGQWLETDRVTVSSVREKKERADSSQGECECSSAEEDEEQHLQVKIQAFEKKMGEEGLEETTVGSSPGPQRHHHSLGQAACDEQREMGFNRSKSLAMHAIYSHSNNPDIVQEGEESELSAEFYQIETTLSREIVATHSSLPVQENHRDPGIRHGARDTGKHSGEDTEGSDPREGDRLWTHMRDNMEQIRAFFSEMMKQIPVPEQCVIEESHRGCVAKLSFSCPLKGHYCLYGKSNFLLSSHQPHLWIRIMLLALQSKTSEALSFEDVCVQQLRNLWEKVQMKEAHSFETSMTHTTVPPQKDLHSLQIHLEEVRFFDLFGYSEEEGGWLCFMCNNPEKATVMNQEGQPLIEGKLKEKQVRWKFIKRWKTRYFTLAGNQLLFRKGKSVGKDELDDSTIELSKVQSVKVVVKKRRDRGLPRAFEIFTENKTFVLKARDEKYAEEWLQCINVAVAQAKERENREATTYLDPHGWTAAHHAAFRGHLTLLRFLLQSGQVELNCRDYFGCTPLHRSCMGGNSDITEYLLQKGASHEIRSGSGQTPLHLAAGGGHLGSARALLKHLAAPDAQDFHRWTPLHWAVCNVWGDVANLLLDKGANLEGVCGSGLTPLQLAVMVGNEAGVRLLLHRGADANFRSSGGRTALHLCACSAEKKILQHLLGAGAKVCVQDEEQATPLHLAALAGSRAVVHLLILNGARLEDRDGLEMTPLHYSTLKDNAEAAKLLLHYGAEVNTTERLGRTALHLAAEGGHCKVLSVLLQRNADYTLRTKWRETAEDVARAHRQTDALLLLQKHSKPSVKAQTAGHGGT